jgi:acyl carrier protein phosphodiesterase
VLMQYIPMTIILCAVSNCSKSHLLSSSMSVLLFSNNDLNKTLEEMVAKFKEWYPDMLCSE